MTKRDRLKPKKKRVKKQREFDFVVHPKLYEAYKTYFEKG